LASAYGLDAITFTTGSRSTVVGDGAGETIALIEAYHDRHLASDLRTFDKTFNLPNPALDVVDQAGKQTNRGWTLEESLDVEWAHAIAPGARILVVEARSQSRSALMAAVDRARRTPGVVAISMSWGFSETLHESSNHFTTPGGHSGITFVAASGDSGPIGGVEWPAVSPNVLAVGGTTLLLDGSGNYLAETSWIQTSSGFSSYIAEPGYQRSVQASGKRSTPDVAFDADPATGVEVYQTLPHSRQGYWAIVGGTSLGAPAWAAILAIADQGRALQGKSSLDGPTQTLPALYSLPATDFKVVTSSLLFGGDTPTESSLDGLGSPNGPALVAALVAL
jgi:subtilase family serine protease